jgi:hypothetical protein
MPESQHDSEHVLGIMDFARVPDKDKAAHCEYDGEDTASEAKPVAPRGSGTTLRFTNNRTVARAYRSWACRGAPSR